MVRLGKEIDDLVAFWVSHVVFLQAKDMCIRYAGVEKRLGEIDRARAVLVHGSQLCDPRTEPGYWQVCMCVGLTRDTCFVRVALLFPSPGVECSLVQCACCGQFVELESEARCLCTVVGDCLRL